MMPLNLRRLNLRKAAAAAPRAVCRPRRCAVALTSPSKAGFSSARKAKVVRRQLATAASPNEKTAVEFLKLTRQKTLDVVGTQIGSATLYATKDDQGFPYMAPQDPTAINDKAHDFLASQVSATAQDPTVVALGSGNSFINNYQNLATGISYMFSTGDQTIINESQKAATLAKQSMIGAFRAAAGTPTPAQLEAASKAMGFPGFYTMNNLEDYYIQYMAGCLWAGKTPKTALTWKQMRDGNLEDLLPRRPPSADPVLPTITTYVTANAPALALAAGRTTATQVKNAIINNLKNSEANDPETQPMQEPLGGSETHGPRFTIETSPNEIEAGLKNPNASATYSFSATKTSSSEYNVHFAGGAGGGFTCFDILNISASTSFEGDVASSQSSGAELTVSITYPGITVITTKPQGYAKTSSKPSGWFFPEMFDQAVSNTAHHSTGYQFVGGHPPDGIKLGQGGFGLPKTLVVAGPPTISVEFKKADFSKFDKWLRTHTTTSLSLFGIIPLAHGSVDTYTHSTKSSSDGSSFSFKMEPPPTPSSPPDGQYRAKVLGMTAEWMGVPN